MRLPTILLAVALVVAGGVLASHGNTSLNDTDNGTFTSYVDDIQQARQTGEFRQTFATDMNRTNDNGTMMANRQDEVAIAFYNDRLDGRYNIVEERQGMRTNGAIESRMVTVEQLNANSEVIVPPQGAVPIDYDSDGVPTIVVLADEAVNLRPAYSYEVPEALEAVESMDEGTRTGTTTPRTTRTADTRTTGTAIDTGVQDQPGDDDLFVDEGEQADGQFDWGIQDEPADDDLFVDDPESEENLDETLEEDGWDVGTQNTAGEAAQTGSAQNGNNGGGIY